ncbi:MAG: aldolase/citrate lyase family protein [Rhodoplanes sp.]
MDLPRNPFKQALAEGRLQIGLWSALASHIVADIIADAGFDWILLDTEHAPNEIAGLLPQLQAMSRGTATPIVRPAWNDTVLIKRIMDLGVHTLLVPWVQSAAEARRAVAATRYAPEGVRGSALGVRASRYGRIANYLQRANAQVCVLVQAETREALDQLEAIAAVEGVDGVFIGPSDLAASLGHTGNPAHPDVQEAIEDAARRLKAVGKAAGILTSDQQAARRYIGWGFTFVAVGSDGGLLARSADALAKAFKAG